LAFLPHTMIGGDTNNDMWGVDRSSNRQGVCPGWCA
jgi:hypothetical protein